MRAASGWTISGLPETLPASVDEVLDTFGIDYRATWSGELEALCPFHDEREASFSVNASTGLWICFAGCGGGNLPQLVSRLQGVPYTRAHRWVRQVDYDAVVTDGPDREMVKVDVEFRESALDCFADPPGWALGDRGISAAAAREYGILWDDDYAEGWVLPIRDADSGVLRGWQTRTDDGFDNTTGTKKSLTLFGIDVFEPGSIAVLVESPLDAAVLLTAGISGGVASFGADVSQRQAELLADRASVIVLALDNDAAGRKGQAKLVYRLSGLHATTKVVAFNYVGAPGRKDPGEMTDTEIRWALRHAVLAGQ